MAEEERKQKTIVVGAGPVGALAALYAASRGDNVEIYELRGDLRDPSTVPLNFTKSINLALSERGINSMKNAKRPGLLESVLKETIPMHGRMIHGEENGKLTEVSQEYDVNGRYIRAVDRAQLNKRLLDELDQMPNVKFFFNHKLTGADFKKNLAWFEKQKNIRQDHAQNPTQPLETEERATEIEVSFDFMIGADGAHSAARFHLMKFARMSYQQEYIDTLWCEFHVNASAIKGPYGDFKISPNHLHIWPGADMMFIAIPSLDHSFTSTLFLPESRFQEIDAALKSDPRALVKFFKTNFPGVVPDLISEDDIRKQYEENPHLPLISIKCNPYHYGSSVVILGDAAHAMVPFYGQGMNAGLEDVRVLYDFIDAYRPAKETPEAWKKARGEALNKYTEYRHPDAVAINDLALRNYQEMSSDVKSSFYLFRKRLEETLSIYVPALGWATQYSRVSFGNQRYSDVERLAEKQKRVILGVVGVGLTGLIGWGSWWVWRWNRMSPWTRWFTKTGTVIGSRLEQLGRRFT